MFFVLIIWFSLSVVIGIAASQRGRDAFGWFLLSILTTPLLAGVLLLLFPPLRDYATWVNDQTLQGSIEKRKIEPKFSRSFSPAFEGTSVNENGLQDAIHEGQMSEASQKRRVSGVIALTAALGVTAV